MKYISNSLVGVIMGSKSDWKIMIHCCDTLKKFRIKHEVNVISAHRTPDRLHKYLTKFRKVESKMFVLKKNTNDIKKPFNFFKSICFLNK